MLSETDKLQQMRRAECTIVTDAVSSGVPLLLSHQALRRLGEMIDFASDKLRAVKKFRIDLVLAANGHLYIPLDIHGDRSSLRAVPAIMSDSDVNVEELSVELWVDNCAGDLAVETSPRRPIKNMHPHLPHLNK